MRTPRITPRLFSVLLGGLMIGTGVLTLVPSAQAAPPVRRLEIWPGQRVLLVLPLSIGPNWNAAPELGQAILPVVSPELQTALAGTKKFSITLPYRFDPVLRRAVTENRISDDEVTSLLQTPTLEAAQPVLAKLGFEQPAMIADVRIEELRVGGTKRSPTAQLQVSGSLYQTGLGEFRKATVTSKAYTGRTPEDRLEAAAKDAFTLLAQQFVEPPESFQLPALTTLDSGKNTATPAATAPAPVAAPISAPVVVAPVVPVQPAGTLSPPASTGFVPQLPAGQPPLGLDVPQSPTVR